MRSGDTLVVPSLDRLSRSLQELITTVGDLRRRGVGFTSLHEHLDTTTPGGRLVFHVFAALAEFSASSSSPAPTKASPQPGPAAAWAAGPASSPPTSSAPPVIYFRTPSTRSPRSPSCSASAPAPSTTTSPTSGSCAPQAFRHDPERRGRRGAPDRLPAPGCLMWLSMTFVAAVPAGPRQRLPEERQASVCPALPAGHPAGSCRSAPTAAPRPTTDSGSAPPDPGVPRGC
jgi:hypothetical protein